MIVLILNAEQQLDLDEMNATGSANQRLESVELPDGRRGH